MKKQLIDVLNKKYGKEYDIEEVVQFKKINIIVIECEDGSEIYKLTESDGGFNQITYHVNFDTILNYLIK